MTDGNYRSPHRVKLPLAARAAVSGALLLVAAYPVLAQSDYPSKPIRILVPFSPGGGTDVMARVVAQKLSEGWKQPIAVVNMPGGGGVIATETLKNSPADGYTLMAISNGHAINATLRKRLPYDTVNDFAGITLFGDAPTVLFATPSLGVTSARELIDLAKSKPGQINFASGGTGSGTHLAGEQFKLAAGLEVVHVSFKGAPEALIAVMQGGVQYGFLAVNVVAPHVKGGKITALAITTATRSPLLPALPTLAEALPGFEYGIWVGLIAPAKTPKEIKDRIAKDVERILASADVKAGFAVQGIVTRTNSPEEFDALIRKDVEQLGIVVRASGASAE